MSTILLLLMYTYFDHGRHVDGRHVGNVRLGRSPVEL